MSDISGKALDALVEKSSHYGDYALAFCDPRSFDTEAGKLEGSLVFQKVQSILDKSADAITALREKLATAERDAYARGIEDAATWLNEQSLTDDELQQGITFRDNYPEYAAIALIAALLPQAEGGEG